MQQSELSTDPFALVVDDEAIIRLDAAYILEDVGFRTIEAEDGDAALAVLQEWAEHIVLLFTDVDMPGSLNGFELAQAVARQWPHVEIVVASGRVKPGEGDMPPQATFVGKPFSPQMIREHLREKLPEGKKPEPLKKAV